ncbi:MAG: hypothetical protein ABSE73_03500 [Planctomycetota bacterium]
MWLIVAFLGVLFAGILLGATREWREEQEALQALNDCEATVLKPNGVSVDDGLSDHYGLVHFRSHRREITTYLSLCETQPQLALRIFRKAMSTGNNSAKLVALYSAFYLTSHKKLEDRDKQLEDKDFQLILACMRPVEQESEQQKVAMRVVSDLTVIDDPGHASRYQLVPSGLPPPAKDPKDKDSEPPPHKVQITEETLRDFEKPVLCVTWSSPVVAFRWWESMAAQGHWDRELQRFVIPPAGDREKKEALSVRH